MACPRSKNKRREDGEEGDIRAENAEMRINIAGLSSAYLHECEVLELTHP
jgi:hypothetical protein